MGAILPEHFDHCPFLDKRKSQNLKMYRDHFQDILFDFDGDVFRAGADKIES